MGWVGLNAHYSCLEGNTTLSSSWVSVTVGVVPNNAALSQSLATNLYNSESILDKIHTLQDGQGTKAKKPFCAHL